MLSEEVKRYRELSGDNNPHTPICRIGGYLDGYEKAMESKTGYWIEHFDESGKWYECNQCHTDWGGSVNYCPNCGAKMQ
jgi:hypothetical protein